MLDRIVVDPRGCEGRPTIRGLRITVDFVLKLIGDGYSVDDLAPHVPPRTPGDPGRLRGPACAIYRGS